MIGRRTKYSLSQLLALQEHSVIYVLLSKYGARLGGNNLVQIANCVESLDPHVLLQILGEVASTTSDLRAPVSPKVRFDERMYDLTQCLALDGYAITEKKLTQMDPSIADVSPIDDDLIEALKNSGAPRRMEIIQKIADSAQAFRSNPPDYNGSLTNARVALETLASDIAQNVQPAPGRPPVNQTKWGDVLMHLRFAGELTIEEEKGLAGVFSFLSPGAHRPVGIPEVQMTRLGRSFALNMCWFLLQNHVAGMSAHRP
ncbi:hypothetical protein [Janthinobacterium sp. HLX7-2]|uniref:hypothetical protein n=1 Tax=Janthinobacterium sp. HLX7-2 TaxID=1259331 RepID=UPI003F27851E